MPKHLFPEKNNFFLLIIGKNLGKESDLYLILFL